MKDYFSWKGDDLILNCRLQPKASNDEFCGEHDGQLKIRITAPPIDGKANRHLVDFIAKAFDVSKSQVSLLKGKQGRSKKIKIKSPRKIPGGLAISTGHR